MGKAKGKVNEKSLDALKKNIKAGGKRKQQSKDTKPATPKGRTSQSRSRSRSRTPARAKKTPPPRKEKKPQVKKSTVTPKLKRLEDEKPTKRTSRSSRQAAKSPGTYKLRPRVQPSEDEVTSTLSRDEGQGLNDSSPSKSKVQSPEEPNRGWFSKCVIS